MQRLSDDELLDLLRDPESDRVERKESFKGDVPKKARQAVCAFANDLPQHNKPGVLFIGVKDNGESASLEITDQLLISLADMKTDGKILPLPAMSVEKRSIGGIDVAVVTVMPSDMPPVKYDGRIWVRTGPRRSIANEQEERILNEKRRYKNIPFDIHPIPSAGLNNLSQTIFELEYLPKAFASDVLEENGRTYEERLASCRMIDSVDSKIPTVTGVLSLGKSPQDIIPGAYIQFLKINGTELTDPVQDEEVIAGGLADMIRTAEKKMQVYNRVEVDVTSQATHTATWMYPPPALQQILYNAVLHRTYESTNSPVRITWFSDRVEINSPGGPYGNVTAENFGHPGVTDYRNPNLADVMKVFGFVQSFGRGIAIARKEMQKNGNPEIEFIANRTFVLCILRGRV